jgi:hypothetical protein
MAKNAALDLVSGNGAFDQIMKTQRTMDLILGRGSALESVAKPVTTLDLMKSSVVASIQNPMRKQLSQRAAFQSLLGPSVAEIVDSARASSNAAALLHAQKFGAAAHIAELISPRTFQSPAINALGSSVAKQVAENFAFEMFPRSTLRAFKAYEHDLIISRATELNPEADSNLAFLEESTTHSPLEKPAAATDAALAVAGKLPTGEDDALRRQILHGIELLQIQVAEIRAAGENDRRRTDSQFFLQLMLVLLTYRFPPQ